LADRLYRQREEKREAERQNEGASKPQLKPVQTPLDDQLPAIQEAMKPLRKAVGAEGMDTFGDLRDAMRSASFQYESEREATEDDDPASVLMSIFSPKRAAEDNA
jgi:hypothetical protein